MLQQLAIDLLEFDVLVGKKLKLLVLATAISEFFRHRNVLKFEALNGLLVLFYLLLLLHKLLSDSTRIFLRQAFEFPHQSLLFVLQDLVLLSDPIDHRIVVERMRSLLFILRAPLDILDLGI